MNFRSFLCYFCGLRFPADYGEVLPTHVRVMLKRAGEQRKSKLLSKLKDLKDLSKVYIFY